MNGKYRRSGLKTMWRGGPSHKQKPPVKKEGYTLPTFPVELKSEVFTEDQALLLKFFESYPYKMTYQNYSYKTTNPFGVVYLKNSDFTTGTVRITVPGVYVLQEDINFEPNPNNDCFATPTQMASGHYPCGAAGSYHLGFFAAITVETSDVIIDLNGHTIKQSPRHNLEQRFYTNIELASSPFIPTQGPFDFSDTSNYKPGSRVLVMNGTLGTSSHHGIHGNAADQIVLYKLNIVDFEVAGIALNGSTGSIIGDVSMTGLKRPLPVLSTFSQARFIRLFLKQIEASCIETLKPNDGDTILTIKDVLNDLDADLDKATSQILTTGTTDTYFNNTTGLYDGNMYGMVLNVNGVVIGNFLEERTSAAIGNINILLWKISIAHIVTHPVEVVALGTGDMSLGAYGKGRQAGPFGDILPIRELLKNEQGKETYSATSLSNAQLLLAKCGFASGSPFGSTSILNDIVGWSESNPSLGVAGLSDAMESAGIDYVVNGDSMGHTMKGNLGLFISGGQSIKIVDIFIDKIQAKGTNVGKSGLVPDYQLTQGADAIGVALTASTDIYFKRGVIKNICADPEGVGTSGCVKSVQGNSGIYGVGAIIKTKCNC